MSLAFKLLVLILTTLAVRMASCLSLDDVHLSLNTFNHNNEPTSSRDNRKSYRRERLFDSLLKKKRRLENRYQDSFGPYSLPIYDSMEFYRRFPPMKKQEEQVINVPLGVSISY